MNITISYLLYQDNPLGLKSILFWRFKVFWWVILRHNSAKLVKLAILPPDLVLILRTIDWFYSFYFQMALNRVKVNYLIYIFTPNTALMRDFLVILGQITRILRIVPPDLTQKIYFYPLKMIWNGFYRSRKW